MRVFMPGRHPPRRVLHQYIVKPRKSNVPDPDLPSPPVGGRLNGIRRVLSGCSVSPYFAMRLCSTSKHRGGFIVPELTVQA